MIKSYKKIISVIISIFLIISVFDVNIYARESDIIILEGCDNTNICEETVNDDQFNSDCVESFSVEEGHKDVICESTPKGKTNPDYQEITDNIGPFTIDDLSDSDEKDNISDDLLENSIELVKSDNTEEEFTELPIDALQEFDYMTTEMDEISVVADEGITPDMASSAEGLNLDNPTDSYRTIDDKIIYSSADGRTKVLIFFSATCGNCRNTISYISKSIKNFSNVDIYAIETNNKSKSEVSDFKKQYGCNSIVFSYDNIEDNSASMWKYVRLAGVNGKITWPVICYIDSNNRFQYMTQATSSAEKVLSNIKKYCNSKENSEDTTYSITYNLNGGVNDSSNPSKYKPTDANITLKNPVRAGFKFDGWYTESSYTNKITQILQGSTGNIILYAKWSRSEDMPSDPVIGTPSAADSYRVVFDGNLAESGEMTAIDIKFGKKKTLPANSFKRIGYSFKGWNTARDGSGKTYQNKASVKNLTDKSNPGIILYAQWKAKTYSIVFNGKGNTSGKMKKMTKLKYDELYTLPLNKFVKKGNAFVGWSTKKNGNGNLFEDGASIENLTSKKNGVVTLYAKWEPIVYNINFEAGGAIGVIPEPVTGCKYGKDYTMPWPNLAKTGYRFKGWYTDPSGGGKGCAPGKPVKNLTKENGAEVTLYAVWKRMSSTEEDYVAKVIEIANNKRVNDGKDPLSVNSILSAVAQERAYEIAKKYSHTRPDGSDCFELFESAGYSYYSVGENIAYGQGTPSAVMKAWINSPGHRANILNDRFTEIGVGCYYANGRYYWVQCFGSSR